MVMMNGDGFLVEVKVNSIRHWINLIHGFLNTFGWLGDSFVLNFYQDNHWDKLPNSWKEFLPTLTPEELGSWLDLKNFRNSNGWNSVLKRGVVPPLGLSAFKMTVDLLSLKRSACSLGDFISTDEVPPGKIVQEFRNLFSRHVKTKKLHEIERFCTVVSCICNRTATKHVFDVGSGQGHLARFLTYGSNLNLTCVDCNTTLGENATKFDIALEKFLSKDGRIFQTNAPSHLCVKLKLNKIEKHLQIDRNFGLIGLHACGNLSPVIIHNFVNSPARFLVSVGCCYMKLDDSGFPLSKHCKDSKLHLSYESFEVSCHALEQYSQRLKDGFVTKLMTHAYRAALETILVNQFGIIRAGLKGVRNCENLPFEEYAHQAVRNHSEINLSPAHLKTEQIDRMLKDWYKVVLFYSLRLLIANVIETTIILDRALFIKENFKDSSVKLLPLFDPILSPRNCAIVAEKDGS